MLNSQIFEAFSSLRRRNVPIEGPAIKKIGLKLFKKMIFFGFKTSNCWLDRFNSRHKFSFKNISGKSNRQIVASCKYLEKNLRIYLRFMTQNISFFGNSFT